MLDHFGVEKLPSRVFARESLRDSELSPEATYPAPSLNPHSQPPRTECRAADVDEERQDDEKRHTVAPSRRNIRQVGVNIQAALNLLFRRSHAIFSCQNKQQ